MKATVTFWMLLAFGLTVLVHPWFHHLEAGSMDGALDFVGAYVENFLAKFDES